MPSIRMLAKDAELLHSCVVKFIGQYPEDEATITHVRENASRVLSTSDDELATWGVCDPPRSVTLYVENDALDLVWDALNIYAYDAGNCPCCENDGEGYHCIIQRWHDFVSEPSLILYGGSGTRV